jgi:hypothetical protein
MNRFPAELTGAHSVTFLLPEGMPMPAGDAGHSKDLTAWIAAVIGLKAVMRQRNNVTEAALSSL